MIYASTFSSFSQLAVCLLTCLITMFWLFFCWMNVPIGILHTPRVQQNVIIIIRWQNDDQYKTRRQVLGRLPNGNTIRLMWFSINHQPHNATDNENTKTIKKYTHLLFSMIWFQRAFCVYESQWASIVIVDLWFRWFTRLLVNWTNENKTIFKIIQLKWAFK